MRVLLVLATFAMLGLGTWAGSYLRPPVGEVGAGIPTATTSSPGYAAPPASTATPTTAASPPATDPPAAPPPEQPPPPTPPADSGIDAFEQQVVELANAERAAAGCPALTVDDRLTTAARGHSADMAARDYFDHTTPEGVTFDQRIDNAGYSWRSAAENIAAGQRDPASVMTSWMNSEGHRHNILNCDLQQIGVGLAYDPNNRPYWTQDFATPR